MQKIIIIPLTLIIVFGSFLVAQNALAISGKEYRFGQIVTINKNDYVIAGNNEFAEILEIKADNKLSQISEVHGSEVIKSLFAGQYANKNLLFTATGRYLYQYDISDPKTLKIEIKRDLYEFKRGQYKIGSVNALAGNRDYLFGAGSYGVRSFYPDNLFVNKIYTFDPSYGLAVDNENLFVITETKGLIFNIASGEKLAEVVLENKNKVYHSPYFDKLGNAYFPSDRGLIKINKNNQAKKIYQNPVPKTDNYSYDVTASNEGIVYYANGHGITVFDKNFNKVRFLNTSKVGQYGSSSWAVGITTINSDKHQSVVVFNKSAVLLLDKNLSLLSVYKYQKKYPDYIVTNLKIESVFKIITAGKKTNFRLFGFWPNENVNITLAGNKYLVRVDNQGYALVDLYVPYQESHQAIIQAVGDDSKLSYQILFTVW